MRRLISGLTLALSFAALFVPAAAAAQEFPAKPIRILVGYPPGSQTDILARLVADEFYRAWRQPATVENVSGASGNIATAQVYRSEPDGYTLLAIPPGFVINPFVFANPGFSAEGWKGVSLLVTTPYMLVARSGLQANSVAELVALARARPGQLTYASGGVGSSAQLSVLLLETLANVKMIHVPYRGAAPALTDVIANHVDIVFDALSTTLPAYQNGSVKVLGVGGGERAPALAQAPPISETLPGFESVTWTAIVAPPRTPAPIVEKLSTVIRAAMERPDNAQRFKAMTLDVVAANPTATDQFLAKETNRWGKIAREAGIELQ